MNKDEELTLLNVLNHYHFKEVSAEVKRLRWEVMRLRREMGYYAACIHCRIDGDDLPLWNMRDGLLEQAGMTLDEAMIEFGFWGGEEE